MASQNYLNPAFLDFKDTIQHINSMYSCVCVCVYVQVTGQSWQMSSQNQADTLEECVVWFSGSCAVVWFHSPSKMKRLIITTDQRDAHLYSNDIYILISQTNVVFH